MSASTTTDTTDTSAEHFGGFEDNHYQHSMHTMANITLWSIVIIGVLTGLVTVLVS